MSVTLRLFKEQAKLFVSQRDAIISEWTHEDSVVEILQSHDISLDLFTQKFAYFVLDYFIAIAHDEAMIGDCPVMGEFLQFLRDKDITASELFRLCTLFRRSLMHSCFNAGVMNDALYDAISSVFDENFAGVLKHFNQTIKNVETELSNTQRLLEHYKQAIDVLSIVSMTNKYGIITYVNDAFCHVSGYTREELLGHSHNIVRHEDTTNIFFDNLWKTISEGKVFHDTIKNRTKQGDAYYVDTVIVPIKEENNTISGYISVRHDITENITAVENALLAEEEALDAKAKAEAAERSKDDFLAAMSHEIRTPLNAILGFVAILQKSKLPNKEKGYLDIIDSSGQSLLSIINDILDFAKIKSGKFEIDPYPCDPIVEVENILELFSSKMLEKGIDFISYIDPSLPALVLMDGLRIRQIISNFLSNAVKFTPEGGLVHVKAYLNRDTERFSIYVQDSGIGIKKENIDKVFGAFNQEESSTSRHYGGTGLGLSISKSLATIMDGEIGVQSLEGKGSSFFLHIPVKVMEERAPYVLVPEITVLAQDMNAYQYKLLNQYCQSFGIKMNDAVSIQRIEANQLIIGMSSVILPLQKDLLDLKDNKIIVLDHIHSDYDMADNSIQRLFFPLTPSKLISVFKSSFVAENRDDSESVQSFSGHILVAEDNLTNQQLIGILLEERGLSFDLAINGQEAVDLMRKNDYDLVLMDNNMPIMGGIEATKYILEYEKKEKKTKTPIIALTANATVGDKAQMFDAGMDDFLSKPIDIKELDRIFASYINHKINNRP